jgi:hypothetical protein
MCASVCSEVSELRGHLDRELDAPTLPMSTASLQTDERFSFWLFDTEGRYGVVCWHLATVPGMADIRREFAGFILPGGRALVVQGEGPRTTSAGPGAAGSIFRCEKPFGLWTGQFRGTARDASQHELATGPLQDGPRVLVELTFNARMAAPPWVLGGLSDNSGIEIGRRYEQLFRADVDLRVGAEHFGFSATGVRTHNLRSGLGSPPQEPRPSPTPSGSKVGITWQTALFPSGRAFGSMRFAREDGSLGFTEGFVLHNGELLPARVVDSPWRTAPLSLDAPLLIELESVVGTSTIMGQTVGAIHKTVAPGTGDRGWFRCGVHPVGRVDAHAIARYEWREEATFGLLSMELPSSIVNGLAQRR